jgi:hypothetical protein
MEAVSESSFSKIGARGRRCSRIHHGPRAI